MHVAVSISQLSIPLTVSNLTFINNKLLVYVEIHILRMVKSCWCGNCTLGTKSLAGTQDNVAVGSREVAHRHELSSCEGSFHTQPMSPSLQREKEDLL